MATKNKKTTKQKPSVQSTQYPEPVMTDESYHLNTPYRDAPDFHDEYTDTLGNREQTSTYDRAKADVETYNQGTPSYWQAKNKVDAGAQNTGQTVAGSLEDEQNRRYEAMAKSMPTQVNAYPQQLVYENDEVAMYPKTADTYAAPLNGRFVKPTAEDAKNVTRKYAPNVFAQKPKVPENPIYDTGAISGLTNAEHNTNAFKAQQQAEQEARFNQLGAQDTAYNEYKRDIELHNEPLDRYEGARSIINQYSYDQLKGMLSPDGLAAYNKLETDADRQKYLENMRSELLMQNEQYNPNTERQYAQFREDWNQQNPAQAIDQNAVNKRAQEIQTDLDYNDMMKKQRDAEPKTWQELRDQMYGSEEDRRKEAKRRAAVNAIGDSLRHIGNLFYTTKGATPQKFETNPTVSTLDEYNTGKKERDAMSYQMWQQKLKDKQQEVDNARKDRELVLKEAKTKSDIYKNDASTKKILQDLQIDEKKFPYEMKLLAGNAAYAIARGKYEEANAIIEKLEAENKPEEIRLANKLKEASIEHQKASANAANASAEASHAQAARTRANIVNDRKKTDAYVYNKKHGGSSKEKGDAYLLSDGKWVGVPKSKSKNFTTALSDYVKKHYKSQGEKFMDDYYGKDSDGKYTEKDWASYAESLVGKDSHIDDIVRVYGGETDIADDWGKKTYK